MWGEGSEGGCRGGDTTKKYVYMCEIFKKIKKRKLKLEKLDNLMLTQG